MRVYDQATPCPSNRYPSPISGHRRSVAIDSLRFLVPLLLITGGAIAPHAEGGSITYDIIDYPTLENGYTLAGTITTNGNTGTTDAVQTITSWDISVLLSGVPQSVLTTANSSVAGQIDTSQTTLSVASQSDNLAFVASGGPTRDIWDGPPDSGYAAFDPTSHPYWITGWQSSSPIASAQTAGVPEPSSVVLGALGAVAIMAYDRYRRRRDQRRPRTRRTGIATPVNHSAWTIAAVPDSFRS